MLLRSGRSRAWRGIAVGILLGAAVFAPILATYRVDIEAARARVNDGSKVKPTPCGLIEYADVGEGAPVLAIHGAGGGFDQGLDITKALARGGFRVVAMSRFGYLRTPMPADGSPEAQARTHACLLDALHLDRVAVLGASAGATSAMQFAILFPERTRKLVLLVPAAYVPRPDGAPPVRMPMGTQAMFETALRSDFLMWAAIHTIPGVLTRALLATPPHLLDSASHEEKHRVDEVLAHILPVSARRRGLLNDGANSVALKPSPLDRIAAPTLVISAKDDLFGTYDTGRYTAEHIPGARFVGYESGGHVLVGRQGEAGAEISAFLR